MNPDSTTPSPELTPVGEPTPEQTPANADTPEPKKRQKLILIILSALAGLGVLLALLYFFVFGATNAAAKVSHQFVGDIQKKDAANAYSLGSDAFRDSITELELESTFISISPALQGSYKDTARKIEKNNDKDFAVIVYTVKTENGDKYVRVVLEKNDKNDKWEVINFRSSSQKLDPVIE